LPEEQRDLILSSDIISPCITIQYAISKIPIKLSSVTACDRDKKGACDHEYTMDILDIFIKNPEIKCILCGIGLMHITEIKLRLKMMYADINVIIVNTASMNQIEKTRRTNTSLQNFKLTHLLSIEPSYDLPGSPEEAAAISVETPVTPVKAESTFKVLIRHNSDGNKIYECPICGVVSGTAAPKNPSDFSLFSHRFGCPNKNKIPIE
jgi:hypothetical protein